MRSPSTQAVEQDGPQHFRGTDRTQDRWDSVGEKLACRTKERSDCGYIQLGFANYNKNVGFIRIWGQGELLKNVLEALPGGGGREWEGSWPDG